MFAQEILYLLANLRRTNTEMNNFIMCSFILLLFYLNSIASPLMPLGLESVKFI